MCVCVCMCTRWTWNPDDFCQPSHFLFIFGARVKCRNMLLPLKYIVDTWIDGPKHIYESTLKFVNVCYTIGTLNVLCNRILYLSLCHSMESLDIYLSVCSVCVCVHLQQKSTMKWYFSHGSTMQMFRKLTTPLLRCFPYVQKVISKRCSRNMKRDSNLKICFQFIIILW